MKGFLDVLLGFFLVIMLMVFLIFGPDVLELRIKQQYLSNILPLTSQDALLTILSVTNFDELSGKNKPTIEILGEREFLKGDVDFLIKDLDIIVKSKCYSLQIGTTPIVEKSCGGLGDNKAEFKIVLPYNPKNLVEKIKLVIK